jgi:hypothetical protein
MHGIGPYGMFNQYNQPTQFGNFSHLSAMNFATHTNEKDAPADFS